MERNGATPSHMCASDVTFRFPDGHTWRYAGCERVWKRAGPYKFIEGSS